MKTTFILHSTEIKSLKQIVANELLIIDYYMDRKHMIRWYKKSPNQNENNIFFKINGLIDISYYTESVIPSDEAKSLINRKNIKYLVRRKLISKIDLPEIKDYGQLFLVCAEDVKNTYEILNEYHLVFDDKVELTSIAYLNFFYGNTYDYLEGKNELFKKPK